MAVGAGGAMMTEAATPAAGVGVVKIRVPIDRGMALGAVCAEGLIGMIRGLGVAGDAVGRRAGEDIIGMAPGTGQGNMCAGQ
jgi:hypothetical protein